MEVHAHTHTVPIAIGRKKFIHYFWEFFMLFLAVFCGFLAENFREHEVEHQREKKYIISLIKDVELDIASLENSYDLRKVQIRYFDSLTGLLRQGYEKRTNDFYFYARHITRSTRFQYHDRTIQQLKNSGNLRLIRNNDAADSITVYDNEAIKTLLIQQDNEDELRKYIATNLAGNVLSAFAWDEMNDSTGKISKPINSPSLITKDPKLLSAFTFNVIQLKATLSFTNRHIIRATKSAKNLIELLKKEYHLE